MKDNKDMKCDPCERDFKKKVDELVKEGKAPSHMDRMQREHEIKSVFGEHHITPKAEMKRPAPKKEPAMAGGQKMKK